MWLKNASVHIAEHDVNITDGERIFKVAHVFFHPNYDPKDTETDYDFAILELAEYVDFSDHAMPICLPDIYADYDSRVAIVAGWGSTNLSLNTPTYPNILQKVTVFTMNNKVCKAKYQRADSDITKRENMICADHSLEKDSCKGDSGGPLITMEDGGYFSLIGVVSTGKGCAYPNLGGIYGRVTEVLGWIQDHTTGKTCPRP